MALDEPEEGEESVNVNGVDVLVSEKVLDLVADTVIDYVKQPDNEGFVMVGQGNCC
jgi:Fe-S cluster assembly iron-binding protein IscA